MRIKSLIALSTSAKLAIPLPLVSIYPHNLSLLERSSWFFRWGSLSESSYQILSYVLFRWLYPFILSSRAISFYTSLLANNFSYYGELARFLTLFCYMSWIFFSICLCLILIICSISWISLLFLATFYLITLILMCATHLSCCNFFYACVMSSPNAFWLIV